MELNQIIGYSLAVLVGITLGLVGSGGSILSVPILVYIMGIEPILATAYSLFIVGATALVGGFQKARNKLVDFKKVLLFGIPTIIAVFFTRRIIVPKIPDEVFYFAGLTLHKATFIMLLFAVVMVVASIRMIKPIKEKSSNNNTSLNYFKILITGLYIGLIAGLVGAGGGFLIIPALVFLAKTPMKIAVGTSLFIVATQSLIGFLGDIRPDQIIDWQFLSTFTGFSVVGIFIGNAISKVVSGEKLKTGFGYMVLLMGIYILLKELVLT